MLSDAPERPPKRSGKVVVVQAAPIADDGPAALAHDANVHLALDPEPPDAKPVNEAAAAAKSCSGVVNRRS